MSAIETLIVGLAVAEVVIGIVLVYAWCKWLGLGRGK